jgi:Spy/CpxP family protein refolding chaperone
MKLSKLSLAIIAAAGLLSLAPSIQAQTNVPGTPTTPPPGRRGGGMSAEARLTAFETALGSTNKLTEAQKPKVKAVIEEQTKKMQELMGQRDSLSAEDLRTKRTALTEDINKKMKEILNADQYKVWEQQAQRGRGGRRQGGGGGGGQGN